jgi:hypothetical protein
VAHVDGQTLEVGAREAVPEHIITHNTTTAEGADRRKVFFFLRKANNLLFFLRKSEQFTEKGNTS